MKDTFFKAFLLAGFLLINTTLAFAQPKLYPIKLHSEEAPSFKTAKTQGDSAIFVTIPFFEDFANQFGSPDTSLWQAGEGVFVNNTFGINTPTIGVATFDGLQESGLPYSLDALGLTGEADRLTSHCFDLTGYVPADDLTLSFYWQAQGLGELPNAEDFLKLEFRDDQGEWVEQWHVTGDTLTPFNLEEITLIDPSFFHDKFQFRFVNFGRLSGGYDTWNIDYIYFNKFADRSATFPSDFGFKTNISPTINTYTSVPARHFLSNINTLWNDTIATEVRSVFSQSNNLRDVSLATVVHAPDTFSKNFVKQEVLPDSFITIYEEDTTIFLTPDDTAIISFNNDQDLLNGLSNMDSFAISHTFILDNGEFAGDFPIVRANDTVRSLSVFSDYYAYDDGTAELGYGVNERFGKIAVQFELLEPDTLRYIDVFLAQLGGQASGSFKIKVWESIDTVGGEEVELYSTASLPILYPEGINTFQRLSLDFDDYLPLPKGTFFLGIEQLSDQNIMIGFDKNNDNGSKIFYNLGNKWFQNKQFNGSLMLRPAFEFPSTVTGIDEDLAALKGVKAYPNPTRNQLWLDGEIDQITLYSMSGKAILSQELSRERIHHIQLPNLQQGLYILKMQKGKAVSSKKIVIIP